MDVTVVSSASRSKFTIVVDFFDTVWEMKQKIQLLTRIPIFTQTLLFKGQIMEDQRDTEFYKILGDSVVELIPSSRVRVKVVSAYGSHKVVVEVDLMDSVAALRKVLEGLNCFPLHDDDYFFGHRNQNAVMEEDRSFKWHGVEYGHTIDVIRKYTKNKKP